VVWLVLSLALLLVAGVAMRVVRARIRASWRERTRLTVSAMPLPQISLPVAHGLVDGMWRRGEARTLAVGRVIELALRGVVVIERRETTDHHDEYLLHRGTATHLQPEAEDVLRELFGPQGDRKAYKIRSPEDPVLASWTLGSRWAGTDIREAESLGLVRRTRWLAYTLIGLVLIAVIASYVTAVFAFDPPLVNPIGAGLLGGLAFLAYAVFFGVWDIASPMLMTAGVRVRDHVLAVQQLVTTEDWDSALPHSSSGDSASAGQVLAVYESLLPYAVLFDSKLTRRYTSNTFVKRLAAQYEIRPPTWFVTHRPEASARWFERDLRSLVNFLEKATNPVPRPEGGGGA
jgi:hypothetical protein